MRAFDEYLLSLPEEKRPILLLQALKEHDFETYIHSVNVAIYMSYFAEYLNFPKDERKVITDFAT
ncbi:hypothetical protein [Rossellomorea vietnamensis]|jgi:HD-GYP domain-containing protein (c-di-GMP phosphodiesterase class II)|uniref:hypothetical protein n=1 Tax=Rossellomorea vietnamensis TaxID=218284 RepID=UPI0005508168|nr:hypothetical protein [Rossellomorea vietnamensis]OXS58204.1 hypothetical protein B1B00_14755 [Bacillus sp. DSM 27956]PRX75311.1 hypothetical protein B0G93_11594 [Bacillus sp. V-88]SLK23762.1 hypothetical protein SAMN06295884_11594 [Bacillus sp. V-88]